MNKGQRTVDPDKNEEDGTIKRETVDGGGTERINMREEERREKIEADRKRETDRPSVEGERGVARRARRKTKRGNFMERERERDGLS